MQKSKYHFHACSLGEMVSIEPIVALLGGRLSCITQTGFERGSRIGACSFLPFECFLPFWWRECDTLVVFEAELWLNLFKVAKKKGARTILLNARISDRSYKNYLRFRFYYRYLFRYVDLVLAQSALDKERLESLGAKNVKVMGNVKSAMINSPKKEYKKPKARLIIVASSHENEEKNLLQNIALEPTDRLFIAPRHPERFGAVLSLAASYAKEHSLSFAPFSSGLWQESQVVVVDCLGELVNLYAIADIAIICGSFEPGIGGHNPIEAVQFGCKIISGKFIENQKALYASVGGVEFCDYGGVMEAMSRAGSSNIMNRCDFKAIINEIRG